MKKKHTFNVIPPSVLITDLFITNKELSLAIIRNYEFLTSRELKVYPKYCVLINKNELNKKVREGVMATSSAEKQNQS